MGAGCSASPPVVKADASGAAQGTYRGKEAPAFAGDRERGGRAPREGSGPLAFVTRGSASEEFEEVAAGQGRRLSRLAERRLRERALALLELQDPLLHRPLRNQSVDEDRLVLADAVRPVGGLILRGGVPPGVEEEDVIGCGQVEPGAA